MPYKQNTEYDLKQFTDSKYIISSHHRRPGGNPDKSTWRITHDEEVDLFIYSKNSGWVDDFECWGLVVLNKSIQVVGYNNLRNDLKIAKFVDSDKKNVWHGYPADCKNKINDIPNTDTLIKWKENNFISKSVIRKIQQQIPCDL